MRTIRTTIAAAATGALLLGLLDVAVAGPASADAVVSVPANRVVSIAGHGWGHGRGMSQNGAYGAAAAYHKSAAQILDFYYTGTTTTTLGDPRVRVQLTSLDLADPRRLDVENPGTLRVLDESTGTGYVADKTTSAAQRWSLSPTEAGIAVRYLSGSTWKAWRTLPGPVRVDVPAAAATRVLYPTSRTYTSSYLRVSRLSASAQSTTAVTTMQSYLRGVVPAESLSFWPAATLQAQAVAARSYTAYHLAHPRGSSYDICDTTSCQVYTGDTAATASTDSAIDATAGQVRTVGGAAIRAEFSASNGGWSTSGGVSYLTARRDPYDGAMPTTTHSWTAQLPASALEARYPSIGRLTTLAVTSRDGNGAWGGRVRAVTLRGTRGSVSVSGTDVYSAWAWPAHPTGLRSSWWSVRDVGTDLTGDGVADLAVGTPGRTVTGQGAAGALAVVPGRKGATIAAGGRLLSQDSPGIPGGAESSDRFASTTASGDFDGDGRVDVAVGVPNEDLGTVRDAGLVQVLRGSASGLTTAGLQQITLDSAGVVGAASTGTGFGSALAAGDLDGDGFDDLVVATPAATIGGQAGAGMLTFVPGSANGLVTTRSQAWTQASAGVAGDPEAGDRFGAALATGDVDGDGRADLAVGVPGERTGTQASGGVQLLRGVPSGLVASGAIFGTTMHNAGGFGRAVALVDTDRDRFADLAAAGRGAPGGAVTVVPGSAAGLTAAPRTITQDSRGVPGADEVGDSFGAVLAGGDLDGDGYGDLVVANPTEALGTRARAGAVVVLYGSAGGAGAGTISFWTQDSPGVLGAAAAGDLFARSLSVTDLSGDGIDDLAVGAPGNGSGTGSVSVLYGSEQRLTAAGDALVTLSAAGASPATPDGFGSAVAAR